MRVHCRVAQGPGHPVDQRVRHRVLQPLRLGVHGVPGVAEELDQVRLEEAVAPEHSKRGPPPGVGELHALVGDVLQ